MTAQKYDYQTAHSKKYEESRLNADRSLDHIDSVAS